MRNIFVCFHPIVLLILLLFGTNNVWGQSSKTVRGSVVDDFNEPMIGVSVMVPNSTVGTVSDLDGNFVLTVTSDVQELQFSYVGYITQMANITTSPMRIVMREDAQVLESVVVIGYGTQRKSDLTGSISSVNSEDFNGGLVNSPQQLINGKISGVQIMSDGGSPTGGSSIRIRGGASLNASNDPLIVLDGVPLETGGISGSGNFLSLINPSDIESMTVLKDASSTAIYGSRASNGVILITTKKGSADKFKVNFTTTQSVQTKTNTADMLSTDEFVSVIKAQGSNDQISLLGNASTDWNNEIFQTAYGTDNNVSFLGQAGNWLYRASFGYYYQNGIVKTDNAERYTGSISLNPSFFDNHLKLVFNAKGAINKNRFIGGVIHDAAVFNPTLPVYSGRDAFGGYTESLDENGIPSATLNPVGGINNYKSTGHVKRFIGNIDLDYRFHFLPEMKAHMAVGYDYGEGQGLVYIPDGVAQEYETDGRNYKYGPQKNTNKMFTGYLNYNKFFDAIKSNIDLTAGYDFQKWVAKNNAYDITNVYGDTQSSVAATDYRHALVSFYGRANLSFDERYLLTATVRGDATSRFSKDNRWGTFPSVGLGWRLNEEAWMKGCTKVDNLKLRVSYGKTGQQDGIGDYGYMPIYSISQPGAYYYMGSNYIPMYRPASYISDIKWETTTSFNYGVDFSLFNNRFSGSFDYYTRKTKDLLAEVPVPAGSNFNTRVVSNVGNVDSKGLELTLNATPIETKDVVWNISFNATWQKMKVKNLSLVKGTEELNTLVGPTLDTYNFQVLTEGYEPYMFYLYHQLYDESGKPIEGKYADINGDGQINEKDRYRHKSPAPDYILGLSSSIRIKKWTVGFGMRANIGNYVYNANAMNMGAWETVSYNKYQLNNLNRSYLDTGFQERQRLSDYYLENASFLKMDNLNVGYNFGRLSTWCSNFYISAMMQNVFTITKYSGVDPEVPNGMDNSFYPRPRIYSVTVGIEF